MTEDTTKKEEKIVDQNDKSKKVDTPSSEKKTKSVPTKITKKKRGKRQIHKGQAHIQSTYNNTIVTVTDLNGSVLGWSSAGLLGFKGAKKSTPYAASQVVVDIVEKVQKHSIKELQVFVKGVGGGRDSAVRALAARGFDISLIKDITPVAHNGCTKRKPRRV
ncbi:MAG: 30S ribosomal protein S11 [Candidatus Moranbacteria bacterium]|nr:30S ribosomal protein S11 [Candidatus Moranbacteria bacterium]